MGSVLVESKRLLRLLRLTPEAVSSTMPALAVERLDSQPSLAKSNNGQGVDTWLGPDSINIFESRLYKHVEVAACFELSQPYHISQICSHAVS